jgi:transposase
MKKGGKQDLPRDVDALLALIAQRDEKIATLEHNLAVFARMLFGKSSEKRKLTGLASGHPHQLHLFMADLVADAERIAEESGAQGNVEVDRPDPRKRAKKKGRRTDFPDHLPVVTSTFELGEDQRTCACGAALHQIGFEESRELERIEVTVVHKTKRAKYACRSCEEGVVTAPGPPRVIEKGLLSAGFLAHVIGERFQFHMPYYRLEQKYDGEGLDLSRSVLERSVARCGELLEPLHTALREEVLAEDIVFTDDTTVKIARAGTPGSSKKGKLWIYTEKKGRHFYDFTDSRSRDGPDAVLANFKGYVQADAYTGYDQIFQSDDVTEVACWAHVRRKFETANNSDPDLSAKALDLIGKLYDIEAVARERELDPDGIAALRQEHAPAVLAEIHAWLGVAEAQVLPKSPMGTAVHYALAQWDALQVYVTDGRLEIDNNRSERAMKPVAVGRKNWLFVQSEGGGKTASIMMSLIQTAQAAGVSVKLYLRDVLQRIATETDVKKLLPHAWKEHFEDEVLGRRNEIIDLLVEDQRGK